MVIAWIGYCLLISGLLALAAFATERALGHFRKPVRWGWFAAIVGSVTLPFAAFLAPGLFPGIGAAPWAPLVWLSEPVVVASAPAALEAVPTAWFDTGAMSVLAGGVWVLLAVGMLLHLGRAYGRLRSEMRTWTPGCVLGSRVMIADDRGPAVVGIRRSVVVMPRWIPELEDRLLRLVFLHEHEHQCAGDHRLFAAAVAALVLMPWNVFLWWQASRLRLAIEFDCDRRVLERGESPRDYADALITVGGRVSAPLLAAAAFAERKPAVEKRLRRMTEPLARLRIPRTLGASGVAALALILVLGTPQPEASMDAPAPEADADRGLPIEENPLALLAERAAQAERTTSVAYDTPPVLQNGGEIQQVLQRAYPRDLMNAGTGGRVEMWLYVDLSGAVANQEIKTSSGNDVLDRAAMEVARQMRFRPASNQGEPTAVWVSQWVTFQVI
ncbi:M56 family metallopeptidase [Candidatus Palauibacter polyketidifaciens]|uniref:M56 family metallopeptidase n=1 Tax=Candidatus Palauibacter polyketidifaciens TaxID=3056740 RepID=UPI00239013F9|nr:M56 family metallopeptidase [Candidatus Palauibacter polyketidifaciens]MDE2720271.1 M56 family metallopeptidase [Candidatus Palauibacter polyketidifaciens]